MEKKSSSALVIGAGIAGIKASLELAENGVTVYLCESSHSTGGALLTMERWFPDNACGMCKSLPFFTDCNPSDFCLRRGIEHANINILLNSKVLKCDGVPGDFTVSIEKKTGAIDPEKCLACGRCAEMCTVVSKKQPTGLLGTEKAVSLANPLAKRKTYVIDEERCTKCGDCVKECPNDAIRFEREAVIETLQVGAVILSSGFESLNPSALTEYGYGRYANVVTSFELEHMLSGYGSTNGKLVRPSNGEQPKTIAFIQCVGSRLSGNDYCSSVCCMFAIKEAGLILESYPTTNVKIFYMDIRAHGRHCEEYYKTLSGAAFVRSRVAAVRQNFANNNLLITSMTTDGNIIEETFDMVVLSAAKKPSARFAELAETLGIGINEWGFAETEKLDVSATSRGGVFVCGSASGPKDIAESVCEASAAAIKAYDFLDAQNKTKTVPVVPYNENIAVVICNCKGLLSSELNKTALATFAKELGDVKTVIETDYLCEDSASLDKILKETDASRLVVAACSIYESAKQVGGIPISFTNIRERGTWAHGALAIDAVKNSLQVAALNARYKTSRESADRVNSGSALVVGGGIAGMEAALSIASRGYEVDLLEKTESLGGAVRKISYTINKADVAAYFSKTLAAIEQNPLIRVHTKSELATLKGFAGDFTGTIKTEEGESAIDCGAVVMATGALDYRPVEYNYGERPSVITQRELEEKIASGAFIDDSVIMLQCVGSRDENHEYCSRVCCLVAVKNAIRLKELNPNTAVSIVYRDMRTYGFNELYYARARELGVIFYSRSDDAQLHVSGDAGNIHVRFKDLGEDINLDASMVVLSAAIHPNEDTAKLAEVLELDVAKDGFFREAEAKFRSCDSTREGIFICGTAAGPKGIAETIAQSRAAANHAVSIIARETLRTGRAAAKVLERRCTGCEQCVPYCAYNARIKDEETKTVIVRESLCQGCGACSSACPNGATSQREHTVAQVFAMIDALV